MTSLVRFLLSLPYYPIKHALKEDKTFDTFNIIQVKILLELETRKEEGGDRDGGREEREPV